MNGKTALGLDANIGALICYIGNFVCALGLIYSIIVIVQDKTNKLARFHAFQSILLTVTALVLYIVAAVIIGIGAAADIGIISLLGSLAYMLVALGLLVTVIFAAIKAFQGQIFKLPVIGDMADKWSN
mgnify:CR=1 FL=1|jgi:Predicted membrane protein